MGRQTLVEEFLQQISRGRAHEHERRVLDRKSRTPAILLGKIQVRERT
jgi:hypothetical protein